MHKMGIAITRAPITIATGLERPSRRVSSEGKPKIPLPITVLTMRAVIVQRPSTRTKAKVPPENGAVYHDDPKQRLVGGWRNIAVTLIDSWAEGDRTLGRIADMVHFHDHSHGKSPAGRGRAR